MKSKILDEAFTALIWILVVGVVLQTICDLIGASLMGVIIGAIICVVCVALLIVSFIMKAIVGKKDES